MIYAYTNLIIPSDLIPLKWNNLLISAIYQILQALQRQSDKGIKFNIQAKSDRFSCSFISELSEILHFVIQIYVTEQLA
jgi:hypothetical protein